MDVVLEVCDTLFLDRAYAYAFPAYAPGQHAGFAGNATRPVYHYEPTTAFLPSYLEPSDLINMSSWPRDYLGRQILSLYMITFVFGAVVYFLFASLSYVFVFDKAAFDHPRYIKGQVLLEIACTVSGLPWIAGLTMPFFLLEVKGWSRLYDTTDQGPGRWYDFAQFPLFIAFTDCFIYWIHRGLHHPRIYKHLHKAHHRWVVPTPFASHAFHPLDGFAQSLPYHIYPILFPLNKFAYIALFVFVNLWTVTIHDGEYAMNSVIINGAACHTMHHLAFSVNYGQFTTLWDRIGGSYRKPNEALFHKEEKQSKKEWDKQAEEATKIIHEVEGEDDRQYLAESSTSERKKVQ